MLRHKRIAKTADQKMYDKCDQLYPKLRIGRNCVMCALDYRTRPADVIHHIIRRANPITRFHIPNLLPLCNECHMKIHDGKISEPIPKERLEELTQLANKSLKGLCLVRGITTEEYYKEQYEKMKGLIL